MQLKNFILFPCLLISLCTTALSAQNVNVKGLIRDIDTQLPLNDVKIEIEGLGTSTTSNEDGTFLLKDVPHGPKTLTFSIEGNKLNTIEVDLRGPELDLGVIDLAIRTGNSKTEDQIPIVTLSDDDLDQDIENQNISGLLSASRDVFVSAAAFTFGQMRFRIRGYDSENMTVYLNGTPMNELNSGRVFWNAWGGLNDVMRNRENDIGLAPISYAFGGVGGATSIDTRAINQRKQLRLSYSISNRSYTNRIMGTWSTGQLKNGWSVSLSGSHRWADEGYIEGTFYDAWAYFLSVDKRINPNHSLNLTAFGAPIKRGRSSGSFQEAYDLTGNNYYNPNWGFQNGEKRNARVGNSHEPTVILRHDWTIGERSNLTTALSYQFGRNGTTALDWFDTADPRPDYYRNLPSFIGQESPEQAALLAEQFSNDPSVSQLNWDLFYDVNRNSTLDIKNRAFIEGQNYNGRWSQYIIEDRRFDTEDLNFYSNFESIVSDNFTINAGLSHRQQEVHNFKVVEDLLDGDYTVDISKFPIQEAAGGGATDVVLTSNTNDDNLIRREGDIFGYNYKDHIRETSAWLQGRWSFNQLEFHLAGNLSQTTFWRQGLFRNNIFPLTSFGVSTKQNFTNVGAKAGLLYKLSGRQYFYANAAYYTRAPFIRNAYVSPRTRDQIVPNLVNEVIQSGEAGYIVRSPNLKGRATVYHTTFENQVRIIRFYNDFDRAFSNYVMSGLDRVHTGAEVALEAKLFAGLSVNAVAAIGDYRFTSRATGAVYQDNSTSISTESEDITIYNENFKVAGMPQQAYTFGLSYRSPKYWFANLNFNYFNDIWIDYSPIRRTSDAGFNLDNDPDPTRFSRVVDQEQVSGAFTMDFFAGKSFKFGDYFLYLNVGVNNILDKQDFITGGFEQLRLRVQRDVETFPTRYFYSFGRNYFINLSFRY